jgi:hypothetical protein
MDEKIILRSVYKITRAVLEPAPDPKTGRYPSCVRKVDSNGDMIKSIEDMKTSDFLIAENESIEIFDGKEFDLTDPYDATWWEAIRNPKGELVIDGNAKRYGTAEFYVERPGADSKNKITKMKLEHDAKVHIFADTKEGSYTKVKLLGHKMDGLPFDDVQAYLLEVAKKDPNKIIDLYTGTDTNLRILLMDALEKGIIIHDRGIYRYGESDILGSKEETVLMWFKNPSNIRILDLIKKETYPTIYNSPIQAPVEESEEETTTKSKSRRTVATN